MEHNVGHSYHRSSSKDVELILQNDIIEDDTISYYLVRKTEETYVGYPDY